MEINNHTDKECQSAKLSKLEIVLLLFFSCVGLCFVAISVISLTPRTPQNEEIDTGVKPTNPVAVLGIPCVSESDCGYHLKCIGPSMKTMTCQCPDGDHQVYVDKQRIGSPRCVGKVGSACHPKFLRDCVQNARCTRTSSSLAQAASAMSSSRSVKFSEFRCECQPGYAANSKRQCDVAFGSPCSATTPCSQDAGLACREGECVCKNRDDIFEEERGQCSVPVGGSCKDDIDCVQFSRCIYPRNYGWGRCREEKI